MRTNQALLVMDVQNGIVARFADKPEATAPFRRAVDAARRKGVPVLFVRVAFREGYPEVSAQKQVVLGPGPARRPGRAGDANSCLGRAPSGRTGGDQIAGERLYRQ